MRAIFLEARVGIETEAGTGNTGFLAVLLRFRRIRDSTEFIKSRLYPKASTNLAQLAEGKKIVGLLAADLLIKAAMKRLS